MEVLGIDIGGSGIKGGIVNTDTGELIKFGKDEERTRPPKLKTGLLGLGENF